MKVNPLASAAVTMAFLTVVAALSGYEPVSHLLVGLVIASVLFIGAVFYHFAVLEPRITRLVLNDETNERVYDFERDGL